MQILLLYYYLSKTLVEVFVFLTLIDSCPFFHILLWSNFISCPWTGTAIGKKNMPAFQAFIALLFTCVVMDVLLISGAIGGKK